MLKKRHLTGLLIAFAVALILGALPGAAGAQSLHRWKMATLAPKHLGYAIQVRTLFTPYVRDATDNTVRLKFYWGGVMGNDEEYIRKMHIGQLQGAGLTGYGSNLTCPEFSVIGLPFLFNDYEEVDFIRKVMFPTFDYYFAQYGFKLLMWIDQDFDQIYSSKWRFDKLEDFKNSKFQTWYGPQEVAMLNALGANPLPIPPTEANAAFKSGIIDSNIGPAIYQVGSQMYTSCKYINTMKTRYAPATVVVTLENWEALDQEYRDNLEAGREEITHKFCIGTRKDNQRCIEGMVKYGLEIVEVDPGNKARIVKAASRVYSDLSGELYPRDLLLEVQRHLASYRKGGAASATVTKTAPVKPATVAVKTAPKVETPKPPPDAKVVEEESRKVLAAEEAEVEEEEEAAASDEDLMAKVQREYQAQLEEQRKEEARKKALAAEQAEQAKKEAEARKIAEAKAREKRETAWKERKRIIAEVQKVLKPMGYYPSTIDGIFGPITYKGIRQYQKDHGLPVTGAIDTRLLNAMGIK